MASSFFVRIKKISIEFRAVMGKGKHDNIYQILKKCNRPAPTELAYTFAIDFYKQVAPPGLMHLRC